MDANWKLQQYLKILGFSLLVSFVCISCEYHNIVDYSFLNKLDRDVELFLYKKEEVTDDKLKENYLIHSGDYIFFTSLETHERSAPQLYDFCNMLDSAKLRIVGEENFIAIWRNGEEAEYASGYEMKWNFFCEWREIIQHGGSHAEYRYWLELAEE
jgi:hypothetical protein